MNHARPAGDSATAAEQPGKEFTRIFVSPLAEYPTSDINMDGIAVGLHKGHVVSKRKLAARPSQRKGVRLHNT